jgi:hypothetical protein
MSFGVKSRIHRQFGESHEKVKQKKACPNRDFTSNWDKRLSFFAL